MIETRPDIGQFSPGGSGYSTRLINKIMMPLLNGFPPNTTLGALVSFPAAAGAVPIPYGVLSPLILK